MKRILIKCLAPAVLLGTVLLPLAAQAAPDHYRQPVAQRLRNQHERIENGVQSGQLTRNEAHRLEARDRQVTQQFRRDRRFNNGQLTSGERRRQQHELSHASRAINRLDSNGHVR